MKRRVLSGVLASSVLAASSLVAMSTVSGASVQLTKVNFVYDFPGPDMEITPIVAAQQQGYFASQGLKVNIIFPPDTSTSSQMLTTGAANIGFITTSDMAVAVQAKAPLLSVANYSMSNNWGLFAKPGSKLTLANLKGKKLFSWGDTWTNAMLPFVVKKAGLKMSDITVVTASNDMPLLLAGKIDWTTSTSNYGVPGIFGATGKNPVAITGAAAGVPNVPVWVYATTKSYASAHASVVKAFLKAVLEGTKYASAHQSAAAAAFTKAYPKSGYNAAYNKLGWSLTVPLLTNAKGKYFVQTDAQWSLLDQGLVATKQIKTAPTPSSYYSNAYLPAQ